MQPRLSVSRPPYRFVSGHGSYITTDTGDEILDASGGAAVSILGYGNQRVDNARNLQSARGIGYACPLTFDTDIAHELRQFLVDSTGGEMAQVEFFQSGKCS